MTTKLGNKWKKKSSKQNEEVSKPRRERVVEMLSLPKDVTLNMPTVNLEGRSGLYIENLKGIVEFDDKLIVIKTSVGFLKIEGKGLVIKSISKEQMTVDGRITGVYYK